MINQKDYPMISVQIYWYSNILLFKYSNPRNANISIFQYFSIEISSGRHLFHPLPSNCHLMSNVAILCQYCKFKTYYVNIASLKYSMSILQVSNILCQYCKFQIFYFNIAIFKYIMLILQVSNILCPYCKFQISIFNYIWRE